MTRLGLLLVGLAVIPLPLVAQSDAPRFEVASIKRNTSGRFGIDGPSFKGTTFAAINVPVQTLISDA